MFIFFNTYKLVREKNNETQALIYLNTTNITKDYVK